MAENTFKLELTLSEEAKAGITAFLHAADKFGKDVDKAVAGKAAPETEKLKGKKKTAAAKKKESDALNKDARDKLKMLSQKKGIDKAREMLKSLGANVCGDLDDEGLRTLVALIDPILDGGEEEEKKETGENIFE